MVHQEKLQGRTRAKTISLCDEKTRLVGQAVKTPASLTLATRVRFPHESPKGEKAERLLNTKE